MTDIDRRQLLILTGSASAPLLAGCSTNRSSDSNETNSNESQDDADNETSSNESETQESEGDADSSEESGEDGSEDDTHNLRENQSIWEDSVSRRVGERINNIRESNGVDPLEWPRCLDDVAWDNTRDRIDHDFVTPEEDWEGEPPTEVPIEKRLEYYSYECSFVVELEAFTTDWDVDNGEAVDQILDWIDSEENEYRDLILDDDRIDDHAVAVYRCKECEQFKVTYIFGRRCCQPMDPDEREYY